MLTKGELKLMKQNLRSVIKNTENRLIKVHAKNAQAALDSVDTLSRQQKAVEAKWRQISAAAKKRKKKKDGKFVQESIQNDNESGRRNRIFHINLQIIDGKRQTMNDGIYDGRDDGDKNRDNDEDIDKEEEIYITTQQEIDQAKSDEIQKLIESLKVIIHSIGPEYVHSILYGLGVPESISMPIKEYFDALDSIVHIEDLPIQDLIQHPFRVIWNHFVPFSLPFIFAAFGSSLSGLILNYVLTNWEVFRQVPELIAIITPMIGMLTNIKSTFSARLHKSSSAVHLQIFDSVAHFRHFLIGSFQISQVQTVGLTLVNSLFSMLFGLVINRERINLNAWQTSSIVVSASLTSAIATNFILTMTSTVIFLVFRRLKISTDGHFCDLVVSILRDFFSVTFLAFISAQIYRMHDSWFRLFILIPIMMTPFMFYFASKNRFSGTFLNFSTWKTLALSQILEQPGSLITEVVFTRFSSAASIQNLVNCVSRNVLSVQASHVEKSLPTIQNWNVRNILCLFCPQSSDSNSSHLSGLLLIFIIPVHLLFLAFISTFQNLMQVEGSNSFILTWQFLVTFTVAIIVQQLFLLHLNQLSLLLTSSRWAPQISETIIPIVSSLTNTSGTATVAVIFYFLSLVHDPNGSLVTKPPTSTTSSSVAIDFSMFSVS